MIEKQKKIFDNKAFGKFLKDQEIDYTNSFDGALEIDTKTSESLTIEATKEMNDFDCSINRLSLQSEYDNHLERNLILQDFYSIKINLRQADNGHLTINNSQKININLTHGLKSLKLKGFKNSNITGSQTCLKNLNVYNGDIIAINAHSIDTCRITNMKEVTLSSNIISQDSYMRDIDKLTIDIHRSDASIHFDKYIGNAKINSIYIKDISFSEQTDISKFIFNIDEIESIYCRNSEPFFKKNARIIDNPEGNIAFIRVTEESEYSKKEHIFAYHKTLKQFIPENREYNKQHPIIKKFQDAKNFIFDADYRKSVQLKKKALRLYKNHINSQKNLAGKAVENKKETFELPVGNVEFRESAQKFGKHHARTHDDFIVVPNPKNNNGRRPHTN